VDKDPGVLVTNIGSTKEILSPVCSAVFSTNVNVTDDDAAVTGVLISSRLLSNAGVAADTAVEDVMALVDTSVASANVTPTIRLESSAACAPVLVVTPVPTVTVHRVAASSSATAAVNVREAVLVPEALPVTENVVLPQPLMLGVASEPSVKSGTVSTISSLAFRGALSSKAYDNDDADQMAALAIVRLLCVSAGRSTAVDAVIAVALTSSTPANVTAAVLVFRLAVCAAAGVVMPVPTVTAHCSYALRVAPPAVRVNVAVLVPVLLPVAVKVVVAHPLVLMLPGVENANESNTKSMVSVTWSCTFSANMNVTDDDAAVTGFITDNFVCCS
jgi:hypothetical protein